MPRPDAPLPDVPLLEVAGLTAGYDGRPVLRDVALTLAAGGSACVIGANGAGKTTLLRCLAGLLPAAAGTIRIAGQPVQGLRAAARVGHGLALVPEGRHVFAAMTVRENLEMGAFRRLWPRRDPAVATDFDRVLALFPRLAERLPQRAGSLSGGEQQMLAIGRALMSAPRILLLDEPSLGLAPLVRVEIGRVLVRLREAGVAILLAEQDAWLALTTTERGHLLADGGLAPPRPAAELLADPRLRETYLGA